MVLQLNTSTNVINVNLNTLCNMDDEYEYEQDALYTEKLTPMEHADRIFNDIYRRDHKLYLNSIEWDTWCTPEDPKTIIQQARQTEIDNHPFNKFF